MGRILVTGGAGFIGNHLVERLVAAEADVLGDFAWPARVAAATKVHDLDVRDRVRLRQVVQKVTPETVVASRGDALHARRRGRAEARGGGERRRHKDRVRNACGSTSEQVRVSPRQGRPSRPPGPIPETSAIAPIDLYGLTKLQGGGQLRPGEMALRLCESILDHPLEAKVEERRAPDRAELVADPTLLREERGRQPIYPSALQLRLG